MASQTVTTNPIGLRASVNALDVMPLVTLWDYTHVPPRVASQGGHYSTAEMQQGKYDPVEGARLKSVAGACRAGMRAQDGRDVAPRN